ncbi:hypothetical protein ACH4C6_06165 [Streptomyces sp. NPDC017943]|uniref:hypothetical protein n=1 Tax=Streptomyces sp. NPDC017943 TaxID=3365019 RepID=UPI0037975506
MLILAVLLLPGLALLLTGMSAIEDRLLREAEPGARHARPRRLRLVHGGRSTANRDEDRVGGTRTPVSARRAAPRDRAA